MSILVLTLLCVYVHYNALGLYIKLFALYKNIFFLKVITTEIRFKTCFQQPNTGFPKSLVLTSLDKCIRSNVLDDDHSLLKLVHCIVQTQYCQRRSQPNQSGVVPVAVLGMSDWGSRRTLGG